LVEMCRCTVPRKGWILASTNHLKDYKIYRTMIKMFTPEFLNNLPQPPKNNSWPTYLTNRNFRT
jgi:hypothetical protein